MKPAICNSDSKQPVLPVACPDDYWQVRVDDLSEVMDPSRDHAYILPDNSVWVLSHDGAELIRITDDGSCDCDLPVNVSELANDANYQTDIDVNTKIAEVFSDIPTDVSELGNSVHYQTDIEVGAKIETALTGITQFDYKVVESLPSNGRKGIIYLVPDSGVEHTEYIWLVDKYEQLGKSIVSSVANYYVSPTGNDAADGLTAATPKKTINSVVTLVKSKHNINGITVNLAAGDYNEDIALVGVSVTGAFNIRGAGMGTCWIRSISVNACYIAVGSVSVGALSLASGATCNAPIPGIKFERPSSSSSVALSVKDGSRFGTSNLFIGGAYKTGILVANNSYANASNITFDVGTSVTDAMFNASVDSHITIAGIFSGTFTGKKYIVATLGSVLSSKVPAVPLNILIPGTIDGTKTDVVDNAGVVSIFKGPEVMPMQITKQAKVIPVWGEDGQSYTVTGYKYDPPYYDLEGAFFLDGSTNNEYLRNSALTGRLYPVYHNVSTIQIGMTMYDLFPHEVEGAIGTVTYSGFVGK